MADSFPHYHQEIRQKIVVTFWYMGHDWPLTLFTLFLHELVHLPPVSDHPFGDNHRNYLLRVPQQGEKLHSYLII